MNVGPAALGATAASAAATIAEWGFTVTPDQHAGARAADGRSDAAVAHRRRADAGGRHGAASSAACSAAAALALWYHFAIMFEALFILTTIDAGTRVGRFMLQELAGHVWKPLGRTSWYPSIVLSSARRRGRLGLLPVPGRDRSARRHQLALAALRHRNQLLAADRAVRGTTILIKMGKSRYAWVTLAPLVVAVGRDAHRRLAEGVLAGSRGSASWRTRGRSATSTSADAARLIFNDNLDAALCIFFMCVVVVVILASAREWYLVAAKKKVASRERSAVCRIGARVMRACLAVLTATLFAAAALSAQSDLDVLQIRPNVYMIAGAGANITVLFGIDGAVVVDAGALEHADRVIAAIKKITAQPIRYVIDTSADADQSARTRRWPKRAGRSSRRTIRSVKA